MLKSAAARSKTLQRALIARRELPPFKQQHSTVSLLRIVFRTFVF